MTMPSATATAPPQGDESPLLSLRGSQQELRRRARPARRRLRRLSPARSPRSSVTTAPASRTLIKGIAGIHPFDARRVPLRGQAGHRAQPEGRQRPRHRGRLPGPRAVRQPRHRPQHVPRPRADQARRARRGHDGEAGHRDPRRAVRPHRRSRSASRSPACPAASGRPSRSPAPCCGTPSSSSSTSRPPRSASPRPSRCCAWSAGWPTTASRVVLICHNLNDVFAGRRPIAVLYLGRMAAQVKAKDVTSNQVVELITTSRSG